jgi:hypothetical protein
MLSPRKSGRGDCRFVRRGGIADRIVLDMVCIVVAFLPPILGWAKKVGLDTGTAPTPVGL